MTTTDNELKKSTLMSYVTSLPEFLHLYATTPFNENMSGLGKITHEEGINKDRSHLMKGIHQINEVSMHYRARASSRTAL